ncbi:polysaccharide pyruvyl transferase WcaK-like protein [Kribbella sp. VKM Ac-2569]|uniref:polysaccharide pyruvyl transferase family protein n=1 Tax=Kribbella sp. VKM Ac-2569 TaxID=2512220 RepID=UPI00102AA4B9|nr:polysaccharide pyruvyl transferase family protein [Kribbella sp. VKM Ac-2569]RZT26856.1 polysaccharide pyruvyl transferase WcaK-like protein [Kribbella sp. VKM Ac-2569]
MTRAPRVAFFGLLGSGNLGNHGSLDAMLSFIRTRHPEAELSCVCAGPEAFERQYGIPSVAITWYQAHGPGRSRLGDVARKAFGKVADLVRMPLVIRKYDVVIVPGMGVFESTVDLMPWGFPYALFLMALSARIVGTKAAFVNVGANPTHLRLIRWLYVGAARLASYRSFRDEYSRDAMRQMGLDTSRDEVYPDLAFGLPEPVPVEHPHRTVGLGVMAYYGVNADRARKHEVYATYTEKIVEFARWLVDQGYRIRLVTGDAIDRTVVDAIVEDLREKRPELVEERLIDEPVERLGDLMGQLARVDVVVASRYHNVLSALRMSKPTISISYGTKSDVLMEQMRLAEFRQPIQSLDVAQLINQFRALEVRGASVVPAMQAKNLEFIHELKRQYDVLSAALFGVGTTSRVAVERGE